MNCTQAQTLLAYRIDGDFKAGDFKVGDFKAEDSRMLDCHLRDCPACIQFQTELEDSQARLQALRPADAPDAALARMRSRLFAQVENAPSVLGWRLRFERFVYAQLRRPRYALATSALVGVITTVLFTQAFSSIGASADVARVAGGVVIEDGNVLSLPEQYREWVFVGSSTRVEDYGKPGAFQNVYISPDAYREYKKSGKFPEGAVMVMESATSASKDVEKAEGHYEKDFTSVKVSVKDSRFDEGWAYFEFNGGKQRAQALPPSAGCLACHRDRAATDHVFTQFYPVLRAALAVL